MAPRGIFPGVIGVAIGVVTGYSIFEPALREAREELTSSAKIAAREALAAPSPDPTSTPDSSSTSSPTPATSSAPSQSPGTTAAPPAKPVPESPWQPLFNALGGWAWTGGKSEAGTASAIAPADSKAIAATGPQTSRSAAHPPSLQTSPSSPSQVQAPQSQVQAPPYQVQVPQSQVRVSPSTSEPSSKPLDPQPLGPLPTRKSATSQASSQPVPSDIPSTTSPTTPSPSSSPPLAQQFSPANQEDRLPTSWQPTQPKNSLWESLGGWAWSGTGRKVEEKAARVAPASATTDVDEGNQ